MKLCTLLEEAADRVGQGWHAVWEDWMRAEDIGSQRKENQGWAVYPIITEKERVLKATVLGNTRELGQGKANTMAQTVADLLVFS